MADEIKDGTGLALSNGRAPLLKVNTDGSIDANIISDGPTTGTDLEGLGKVSVGTSAIELVFSGKTESIIISSWVDNDGIIYVGKSDVTSDGSNAIAFLDTGESLTLDYDDASNAIYVVSDTAAQTVVVGANE